MIIFAKKRERNIIWTIQGMDSSLCSEWRYEIASLLAMTETMTQAKTIHYIAIAAMAKNRIIGNEWKIPWYIPQDFKHFKSTTESHPIIMGRKTFESIGRVLPWRENIVLTRGDFSFPWVTVVHSIDELEEYLAGKFITKTEHGFLPTQEWQEPSEHGFLPTQEWQEPSEHGLLRFSQWQEPSEHGLLRFSQWQEPSEHGLLRFSQWQEPSGHGFLPTQEWQEPSEHGFLPTQEWQGKKSSVSSQNSSTAPFARELHRAYICGGSQIYEEFFRLGKTDEVILSVVDMVPDGDAAFPYFEEDFTKVSEDRREGFTIEHWKKWYIPHQDPH
jgi:dihydrofolate reductase